MLFSSWTCCTIKVDFWYQTFTQQKKVRLQLQDYNICAAQDKAENTLNPRRTFHINLDTYNSKVNIDIKQ